ncbi:MAG: FkbM family methyltransferase [Ruminococcaceae bacterium]|nr:FkbM family methyltransferase [Oscillospiraceae bacterium]
MNNFISAECDIWTYLKSCGKKIVMYGMGNGADKIIDICNQKGIVIEDFFASDGFVRGHSFHGKTVLSYSQIKEKYSDFVVLLSFATSLPEVMEKIDVISSEHELLIPDVPVFGSTLFDMDFFTKHRNDIEQTLELFEDEKSKEVYKNVIYAKLTGKPEYLRASVCDKDEVYKNVLRPEKYHSYADLGAYNGDTVRELANYAKNLKKVYALEPDKRTFKKLSDYALDETRFYIQRYNSAAWNKDETLYFDGSGNRNSNVSDKNATLSGKKAVEISAIPLDDILSGDPVDYIKYDVEGSEREALLGSAKTIKLCSPDLLVSLYHRSEDVFTLPRLVKELGNYKLYLRRFNYYPAWDLNLYAISN